MTAARPRPAAALDRPALAEPVKATRRLTVDLPLELHTGLKVLAAERRTDASAIVRQLVADLLADAQGIDR